MGCMSTAGSDLARRRGKDKDDSSLVRAGSSGSRPAEIARIRSRAESLLLPHLRKQGVWLCTVSGEFGHSLAVSSAPSSLSLPSVVVVETGLTGRQPSEQLRQSWCRLSSIFDMTS